MDETDLSIGNVILTGALPAAKHCRKAEPPPFKAGRLHNCYNETCFLQLSRAYFFIVFLTVLRFYWLMNTSFLWFTASFPLEG